MFAFYEALSTQLFFNNFKGVALTWDKSTQVLFRGGWNLFTTPLGLLILHWFVWFFAWFYCINVFHAGRGRREKPGFLCSGRYWKRVCKKKKTERTYTKMDLDYIANRVNNSCASGTWARPHDAQSEHASIVSKILEKDQDLRVGCVGLHKHFPGKGGTPEKIAVKSLSFGVLQNQCFGLLGHNGAGKTTAINVLTGLFPPSAGTAFINRHDIRTDFSRIYSDMSVCPQHDILWPMLTSKEHLKFYGQLKGLSDKALSARVRDTLKKVNLTKFANREAGGYSGGMKRRLSMANALIGDASVVFMDEPSTGLDPASKHQLWDVIASAKGKQKGMVLTTHSMEEADVLCERIAIMADGEIQCIGPAHVLKRRVGKGYTFQISSSDSSPRHMSAVVDSFVKNMFPSAKLLEIPIGGLAKYEVRREDVVVSKVFRTLSKANEDHANLKMTSWGLAETTLEEVFLKLAALAAVFAGTGATSLMRTASGAEISDMGLGSNISAMLPYKFSEDNMANRLGKIDGESNLFAGNRGNKYTVPAKVVEEEEEDAYEEVDLIDTNDLSKLDL